MAADRYHQRSFAPPAGATEVLLVRHGASEAAIPGEPFPLLADGQGDPALAPEGERQAAAVSRRLAAAPPDRLFVTNLRRTAQTIAPLAAATGLEPVVVPELREVHLGDWEGGEYRIRAQRSDPLALRVLAEERWDVIPNGEPMESFERRVRAGLDAVVAGTGSGRVGVAVVHAGVVAEVCRQATGSRPFAFLTVDNASITRLVVLADGRVVLRGFNDTTHLEDRPGRWLGDAPHEH